MTTLCLCDYVEPRSGCEPKPAVASDPATPDPALLVVAAPPPDPLPPTTPANRPRMVLTHVAVLLLGACGAVASGPSADSAPPHAASAPILSRSVDRGAAAPATLESPATDDRSMADATPQGRRDHAAVALRIALTNFDNEIDAAARRAAIDQNSCRALFGPVRDDCVASVDAALVRQQHGATSRRDAALSVAKVSR